MRNKIFTLILVAVLFVAILPLRVANAAPLSQTKCADPALLKEIGTDLTTTGKALQEIPKTGAAGIYAIMVDVLNVRQKYEDKDLPEDRNCVVLIIQTIIVYATIEDYAVVELADKLGLDKEMVAKNRDFMNKRLEKVLKGLTDLIPTAS